MSSGEMKQAYISSHALYEIPDAVLMECMFN